MHWITRDAGMGLAATSETRSPFAHTAAGVGPDPQAGARARGAAAEGEESGGEGIAARFEGAWGRHGAEALPSVRGDAVRV